MYNMIEVVMCNIVIESNAIQNLVENLQSAYQNQKITLVATKKDYLKYGKYLKCIEDSIEKLKMCFVEECVKSNEIFVKLLENELKGCDLAICFGAGQLIDVVKIVATRLNLKYLILASGLKYGNYVLKNSVFLDNDNYATYISTSMPECVYIDLGILAKANSKDVGELFAFVLSQNLIVCKMLYDGMSGDVIDDFERLLKGVNVFTSENIKLKDGVKRLFKLMLEIQLWLNKHNVISNIDLMVFMFNRFYESKSFCFGESCLIFSILILTLHEKVITNKICMPTLNIGKRIARIKTLFAKRDSVDSAINNFENNIDEIDKCVLQKELYLKNIQKALYRIQNNLSMLKRIYVDKGVTYSSVNIEDYYNTLSVLCDIIKDKYLNVLSIVGAV